MLKLGQSHCFAKCVLTKFWLYKSHVKHLCSRIFSPLPSLLAWIESQNLGASFMHVIYKWHSFEEKFVIHDNHNFQTITFLWQVNVLCEPRESHWRIHHKLYCRKKSQRRCVLEQIDRLKGLVSADLQNLLGQPVDLTVDVSVSEKVGFETPMHTYWQISRCLLLS